jgi:hypothetical protein
MKTYEIFSLILFAIQALAIIIGLIWANKELNILRKNSYNSVEITCRQNSMNLIARYSEPDFIERRLKLKTDKKMKENILECAYLLNYFEEVAIAIKHNVANEEILRDFFGTILKLWMGEDYIENCISTLIKEDQLIFQNVLELHEKWEKNRLDQLKIHGTPALTDHELVIAQKMKRDQNRSSPKNDKTSGDKIRNM